MNGRLPQLLVPVVIGAVAGLALWALIDDSEPPLGRLALAEPGAPTSVLPSARAGRAGDGAPGPPARDPRPPHAPRVPATRPRLEIPAIEVRAHVAALGTTSSGALDVPDNWSVVGRWRGGSKPGANGVAVLVGHVDSQSRPAIFHNLGKLQEGDLIRFVPRAGPIQEFAVVRKRRTSKQSFPTSDVYAETPRPTLRLITCGGGFDWSRGRYKDNLIVYAEKI